jgi:hypothetical protein
MKKKTSLLLGLACAVAVVFAAQVRGDAAGEIGRLAALTGGLVTRFSAETGSPASDRGKSRVLARRVDDLGDSSIFG